MCSFRVLMRVTVGLTLMLLAAATVPACKGRSETVPPPQIESSCSPEAESIYRTILQQSCNGAACHGAETAVLGLDLVSSSPNALVGKSSVTCNGWALVVPGSPENSFLYHKVSQGVPACGEHMPVMGQLSPTQIDCIGQWITSLAGAGCETCGGASCVSLASDPLNCGACGNPCPEGIACQDGACQCPEGQLSCGGSCVDVTSDAANCGGCGIVCSPGAYCESSACHCPDPLTDCAGACADLQVDGANCGTCGNACLGIEACLLGTCSRDCGALSRCGDSCVDTQTNVLHCGACDKACPGGLPCVAGECVCPTEGEVLCGTTCVDLQSDLANCGQCGNVCGAGDACIEGVCKCATTGAFSFKDDIEPILSTTCTGMGCHSGVRPQAGLSLEAGNAYAELVNVPTEQCGGDRLRVAPGSPSQSYVMQKLLNVNICFGTKMPKTDLSLSQTDLDAISDWICSGAENN